MRNQKPSSALRKPGEIPAGLCKGGQGFIAAMVISYEFSLSCSSKVKTARAVTGCNVSSSTRLIKALGVLPSEE